MSNSLFPHRETMPSINIPSPTDYNMNIKSEIDQALEATLPNIDNDYDYDPKDESYNYLINMRFDNITTENTEMIQIANTPKYTSLLYLTSSKTYEICVMENLYLDRIKFKTLETIAVPQMEYTINESGNHNSSAVPPSPKKSECFANQKSSFAYKLNNFFNSNSSVVNNNNLNSQMQFKHPVIYHCADNYIIIENSKKIYLIDFIKKKITLLFTKSYMSTVNIIYTFDEHIYIKRKSRMSLDENDSQSELESNINVRTYVFILNSTDEIYFFTIERGYFDQKDPEVVMKKLPFSLPRTKDIKISKLSHNDPNKNMWYYMITVLKENIVTIYVTDYTDLSLKSLFIEFNQMILNKQIFSRSSSIPCESNVKTSSSPQCMKKLFLVTSIYSKSCLMISNGESTLVIDFDLQMTPYELRNRLKMTEDNEISSSPTKQYAYSSTSMTKTSSIRNLDLSNIISNRKKSSFSLKNCEFAEDFPFEDLSKYELDFNDYSLTYVKEKLCVLSQGKIILIDLWKHQHRKIYEYNLKKDEFVQFVNYPEYTQTYMLTKKRFFKLRFVLRFNKFKDNISQLSYLDQGENLKRQKSFSSINEGNYTSSASYRNLMSSLSDNKRINFTYDDFDVFYRHKIDFLWEIYKSSINVETCFHCLRKGVIACRNCKLFFFCGEEHRKAEWNIYHFFECNLLLFIRKMKDYTGPSYTIECLKQLMECGGKILLELFKFIKEPSDYQEYMIYIHFLADLYEKFGVCDFYKNLMKLLDIWPQGDQRDKIKLHINKIMLIETSFSYLNIKMLYTKFAFEAGYTKMASHSLDHLRELLVWLKKETKQQVNDKGKIVILTGEKVTLKVDKNILLEHHMEKFLRVNQYLENINPNGIGNNLGNNLGNNSNFNNITNSSENTNSPDKANVMAFNIPQQTPNHENEVEFKIFDKFFIYYLHTKATLMKYYMKLQMPNSAFKDTILFIEEISINFEDRFPENSLILCFLYFYISFYLVQINKIHSAIGVLNKAYQIASREESQCTEMRVMCLYNLGLVYHSLGAFEEGVHHLEDAHRLILSKNMSTKLHLNILETLSLAYINKKALRKAFNLIQQSLALRNLKTDEECSEMIKLKTYLNFIIDLVEYDFQNIKKHKHWTTYDLVRNKDIDIEKESKFLVDYVLTNGFDLTKQIADIYSESFVRVLEFLYGCTPEQLAQLNTDNNVNKNTNPLNNLENNHSNKDKDVVMYNHPNTPRDVNNTSQSLITVTGNKETSQLIQLFNKDSSFQSEEIEIKKPFLNMLSTSRQEVLKTLNPNIFKRNLILRDSKGIIDHFNLNYHPIYTRGFQKIIENIRSNFFIKEMTKNQISASKEEDVFNISVNNCLYGLAKYLRRSHIQHMITLEKYKSSMNRVQSKFSNSNILSVSNKSNTLAKSKPQNPVNRSINYGGSFLPQMLERLNLFDYPEANDLLYQIYSEYDDNYLRYIMDNPDIILNFIYNDTNLFHNQDEHAKMKDVGHKDRDGNAVIDDDEEGEKISSSLEYVRKVHFGIDYEDEDEDEDDEESELSILSGQRKFNIYNRFIDDDANEAKSLTKKKIIKKVYNADQSESRVDTRNKLSDFEHEQNPEKIKKEIVRSKSVDPYMLPLNIDVGKIFDQEFLVKVNKKKKKTVSSVDIDRIKDYPFDLKTDPNNYINVNVQRLSGKLKKSKDTNNNPHLLTFKTKLNKTPPSEVHIDEISHQPNPSAFESRSFTMRNPSDLKAPRENAEEDFDEINEKNPTAVTNNQMKMIRNASTATHLTYNRNSELTRNSILSKYNSSVVLDNETKQHCANIEETIIIDDQRDMNNKSVESIMILKRDYENKENIASLTKREDIKSNDNLEKIKETFTNETIQNQNVVTKNQNQARNETEDKIEVKVPLRYYHVLNSKKYKDLEEKVIPLLGNSKDKFVSNLNAKAKVKAVPVPVNNTNENKITNVNKKITQSINKNTLNNNNNNKSTAKSKSPIPTSSLNKKTNITNPTNQNINTQNENVKKETISSSQKPNQNANTQNANVKKETTSPSQKPNQNANTQNANNNNKSTSVNNALPQTNETKPKKLEDQYHFDYGFNEFLKDDSFSKVHIQAKQLEEENIKKSEESLKNPSNNINTTLKNSHTNDKNNNLKTKPIASSSNNNKLSTPTLKPTINLPLQKNNPADKKKQMEEAINNKFSLQDTSFANFQPSPEQTKKEFFDDELKSSKYNNKDRFTSTFFDKTITANPDNNSQINKTQLISNHTEDIINYDGNSENVFNNNLVVSKILPSQQDSFVNFDFNSEAIAKDDTHDIFKDSDFKVIRENLMDINHVVLEDETKNEESHSDQQKQSNIYQNTLEKKSEGNEENQRYFAYLTSEHNSNNISVEQSKGLTASKGNLVGMNKEKDQGNFDIISVVKNNVRKSTLSMSLKTSDKETVKESEEISNIVERIERRSGENKNSRNSIRVSSKDERWTNGKSLERSESKVIVDKKDDGKKTEEDNVLKSMLRSSLKRASMVNSSVNSTDLKSGNNNALVPNIPGKVPNIPNNISSIPGIPDKVPSIPNNIPSIPGIPDKVPSIPGNAPGNVPGIPGKVPSIPGSVPGIPGIPGKVPGIPGSLPGIPGKIPTLPGAPRIPLNGPILPGAPIPTKPKVKPNTNMKPLYWNVVDPRKLQNTAWEKIDDASILQLINSSQLEEEFSVKKKIDSNATTNNNTKSSSKKPEVASTLAPQRQQNITIVLSKLKLNYLSLCEALKTFDLSILTPTICELLLPILPTESEITQIKGYEDISSFSDSDKFVFHMGDIVGFDLRIKSIIFKGNYKSQLEEVKEKIKQIENIIEIFRSDERITEWLKIILAYGNYLNGTSNRGGAFGFKLDAMNKITEIKANDNRRTLLHFIIEWLIDKNKQDLLNYQVDMEDVSIVVVAEIFREIKKSFMSVVKMADLSKTIGNKEEDKSEEFMESFYPEANEEMNRCEKAIKSLEEGYEKLCVFFSENPKEVTFEQFVEIFKKFFKNVQNVKTQVIRQRELANKIKK